MASSARPDLIRVLVDMSGVSGVTGVTGVSVQLMYPCIKGGEHGNEMHALLCTDLPLHWNWTVYLHNT